MLLLLSLLLVCSVSVLAFVRLEIGGLHVVVVEVVGVVVHVGSRVVGGMGLYVVVVGFVGVVVGFVDVLVIHLLLGYPVVSGRDVYVVVVGVSALLMLLLLLLFLFCFFFFVLARLF